jgi:hypothetical protein
LVRNRNWIDLQESQGLAAVSGICFGSIGTIDQDEIACARFLDEPVAVTGACETQVTFIGRVEAPKCFQPDSRAMRFHSGPRGFAARGVQEDSDDILYELVSGPKARPKLFAKLKTSAFRRTVEPHVGFTRRIVRPEVPAVLETLGVVLYQMRLVEKMIGLAGNDPPTSSLHAR